MKTQNRYFYFYYIVFYLLAIIGYSQETQNTDTRTFQLSLVPPIGTNGSLSDQVSNKISLNLVAGHAYGVEAVEVGGFYNRVKKDVRGVQVSGFGNQVGGEVDGLQLGGFININKGQVDGAQVAGFLNLVSDGVKGWQLGGFTNISKATQGLQVAGFNNHSEGTKGIQLAGFTNTTRGLDGLQLAGFVNVAKEVKGVQLSIVNIADSVASGVQFGLLNISKKNGFISPAIESDDVIPYRLTFRSGLDRFYSLLTAGMHGDDYWSYGAGFGSRVFLSHKRALFINPELGWHHIHKDRVKPGENSHLVKLNLNIGYALFKHLYITGGPTLNLYISSRLDETGKPVIDIANDPFWDEKRGRNRYQMWIGYTVGIGF